MRSKYSTIKQIDDSTINVTDHTHIETVKTLKIKYSVIIVTIVTIITIAVIAGVFNGLVKKDHENINNTNISEESNITVFTEDGYVFENSSLEYLDQEDIEDLRSLSDSSEFTFLQLLRFSVNEIYARHGYKFVKKEYYKFYNNYSWYTSLDKVNSVDWEEFNEYEQYNLSLMLKYEKLI